MTTFAVSGYASLDHAVAIDRAPRPDRTSVVRDRLSPTWPDQGGCAPRIARVLAASGVGTELISWFGDDADGVAYLADLRAEGVGLKGVTVGRGARTACSWLMYDPDGGTTCVYDPGDVVPHGLDTVQSDIVAAARWAVLTVGPQSANRDLIAAARERTRLVFAVKADADAFPADLVEACVEQAALISFSRGERAFLEDAVGTDGLLEAGRRSVLVETHGTDGVVLTVGGEHHRLPVHPVQVRDTTGAGDRLLATALAELAGARAWPPPPRHAVSAVTSGIEAAERFLQLHARGMRTEP